MAAITGDFVLLRAGRLRLLVPQSEVGAAEYLEARPQTSQQAGMLQLAGDASGRCYAALSDGMTLLEECPPERFVVTTLGEDDAHIGWCWDELQVLIGVELSPVDLPPAVVAPGTPVSQYAEHDGELAFLCSPVKLTAFALGTGAMQ